MRWPGKVQPGGEGGSQLARPRGREGAPAGLLLATVDRLLHHAHVLATEGTDSYRLAQATSGKGVMSPS